jgi:hypothetical protein
MAAHRSRLLSVSPRRFFDRPDHDATRDERAGAPPVPSAEAAQLLALQRSAGNTAVARFLRAGSQRVAREGDDDLGYAYGATAQDADNSSEESEMSEDETALDPVAQLAAAVAARVQDTGRAADTPPAPPPQPAEGYEPLRGEETDASALRGDVNTGGTAYQVRDAEPTAYTLYRGDEAEGSEEDETEVSEDEPDAAPVPVAPPPGVVAGDQYSTQPTREELDDSSSETSLSEDEPASVPVPPRSGGDQYAAQPTREELGDSSSEASAGGTVYTLPPDAEPQAGGAASAAPATAYSAAPAKKKGRVRRVLEAVAKPFKAAGSALKKLGKRIKGGRKGKKGKVTAAELLADSYTAPPDAAIPAAPPVKYTAQDPRVSGPHPLASSVQGLPLEAQVAEAAEISISEDLPAPPPLKYTNLAKMGMSAAEEFDSSQFLNNKLLAGDALAIDMRRFGLVPRATQNAVIMADRALVRDGLKRVWGWSEDDIKKYFDFGTNRAKQSKVTYIHNEADLKKYVVHSGSTLTYGDPPQPFDTGPMTSKASGPGFAIFVMDADGNIYAGQHRVGLFHHSSFLAGRDVAAAGELKVAAGKLEVMSSKSGHYTPDADQTWQAVKQMAALGVSFASTEVRVWRADKTDFYDGQDFLRRGPQAQVKKTAGRF